MRYAVIVGGGTGTRMATEIPKQFLKIGRKPIILRTIERFYEFDSNMNVILVLPSQHITLWEHIKIEFGFSKHVTVVEGGKTRYDSVKAGLSVIHQVGVVGVHDGVRPFVSVDCLKRCYEEAEVNRNAVPVMPIEETIREVSESSNTWVDRANYRIVQTPQCFELLQMKKGYLGPVQPEFTDDASVMEKAGCKINLVQGNKENIKITTPEDMALAEYLTLKQ